MAVVPLQPRGDGRRDFSDIDPMAFPKRQTAADFFADFTPPDFQIDDILQRAYLYTLTGNPGAGKTTIALEIARCVSTGTPFAGKPVERGRVAIFQGENPDDVKVRGRNMAHHHGLEWEDLDIDFFPSVFDFDKHFAALWREAEEVGGWSLIIIDTKAAYFSAVFDDENNNPQSVQFMRRARRLTTLPGRPAVVVLDHPTKSAKRDELLPRGGGAVLAEVDGNLTLWAAGDDTSVLHHGKLRGPGFEPIQFALKRVSSPGTLDTKGRELPSIIAEPIDDKQADERAARAISDQEALLESLLNEPSLSIAKRCEVLGWINGDGRAAKSKLSRSLASLERDGFAASKVGKWRLTPAGRKEAEAISVRFSRPC